VSAQLCRLTFEEAGETLVARLAGEIDLSNAEYVGSAIRSRVANHAHALIVDMSELAYLDSSGLHVLFDLRQRLESRRQELRLVVPRESPIRRALELVNLQVRELDGSLDDALVGLGEGAV
jgi:anti-anti-sigma factor